MRAWSVAVLLAMPLLGGCLSFLDDDAPDAGPAPLPTDVADPKEIRVTGTKAYGDPYDPRERLLIPSFDGTEIAVTAYIPLTQNAMPDGSAPTFPVVVFGHAFGFFKEMWVCTPMGEPAAPPLPDSICPFENMLERFAEAGFIAVAYDARGFGQSGGQVSFVGPNEMEDLDAVIDWANSNFQSNGKVGLTGISYGGGHALMGWATNPKVTTAAPHQGWFDLYEELMPGNTPKLEWNALLLAEGTAGSVANLHPMVNDWIQSGVTRTGVEGTRADMAVRSPAATMQNVTKPLFVCAGMQDSLFTGPLDLAQHAGGFTRTHVHNGGHGTLDEACWDKTEAWFSYFLRGVDNGVDEWPEFVTVDVDGSTEIEFDRLSAPVWQPYHLRDGLLTTYAGSNATFTIDQRVASNPLQEPGAVWDQTGIPAPAIPYGLRFNDGDSTAVFFESAPLDESMVIFGSPELDLVLPAGDATTEWQVTAQLIHVLPDGSSRIIARGAATHTTELTHDGQVTLRFQYTKADLPPESFVVLKLSSSDLSWFMPYPNNFSVQFTGNSQLRLPFFIE